MAKLERGINDLATVNSRLAGEWDHERNGDLSPSDVTQSSNKKAWWVCSEGHSWQAVIGNRRKTGCPYCNGKLPILGLNDLATTNPELLANWDYEKNLPLTPETVSAGSDRKIWWICDHGHQWKSVLGAKVRGSGCPVCAGRAVVPGLNDIGTTNPGILDSWHPLKNENLDPSTLRPGSQKRVWWICELGHEWQSPVVAKTSGYGCPYCAGRMTWEGFNDLQTRNPVLATEWHPSKNGSLLATQISPGSQKSVWWQCHYGHDWKAAVYARNNGNGCPVCSGRKLLLGFNDLVTTDPELADQWHPSKNGDLVPTEVMRGSSRQVWWQCETDPEHSWKASIANRSKNQSGCPRCSVAGYDASMPGLFYLVQSPNGLAKKIGITNPGRKNDRIKLYRRFGWEIVSTWEDLDGKLILDLETRTLRWIRKEIGLPPFLDAGDMAGIRGASETFSSEGLTDLEIISRVESELKRLRSHE